MKIATLLFVLLCTSEISGQCESQSVILNNGFLKYPVGNAGLIKSYEQDTAAVFDLPDSILFYNGFAKALWFMGIQEDGVTHLSANFYQEVEDREFAPGILDADGMPVADNCAVFGKIWLVTREQVSGVQQLFQADTLTVEQIPIDLLTWPATGNQYLSDETGRPYVERALAPFVDVDQDSISLV